MSKLRGAAVVAAMIGSVSLIGAGAAAACGEEPETPPSVSIECTQDTGNNSVTNSEATGTTAVNITDALNGGSADSSNTQQVCGLVNDDIESTTGDSTGGAGGAIGDIAL